MNTYLITGASRGIGNQLAQVALEHGHNVIVIVRQADSVNVLKKSFSSQLTVVQADVCDASSLASAYQLVPEQKIDVLVNNAGICLEDQEALSGVNYEIFRKTFEVNAFAPLQVTQQFLPSLIKSKNPKLINISSNLGSIENVDFAFRYAYRMSKASLNMFTKTFSVEYPAITALAVHPGWVSTEMGGVEAPQTPEESALGIYRFIESADIASSGGFYDYQGARLPW